MTPDVPRPDAADGLLLQLDGFEGPMDLLLDLARRQKVDLARISILSLVEQYLAIVGGARQIRLELAADWLVMAAWLTWLKSRLLLPASADDPADAELAADVLASRLQDLQAVRIAAAWLADAELAADVLASRLQDLQAVRIAAAWLTARPQLGHEVFGRGAPERFTEYDRSRLKADVPGLLRGYVAALRRAGGQRRYRPRRLALWTVQDALARLEAMLGSRPGWISLSYFLPPQVTAPLERRAAFASTLIAGLELARNGQADIRQDRQFGPILLRAGA